MEPIYDFYTFKDKRKCLHCETQIADQTHAATIFCQREELPDGTIKSCKDDHHSALNKKRNLSFNQIALYHKDAHQRIEKLFLQKKDTVTTEQLNQYGIRLDRPVHFDITATQKFIFYFVGFCFTQIDESQFKLSRHELSL